MRQHSYVSDKYRPNDNNNNNNNNSYLLHLCNMTFKTKINVVLIIIYPRICHSFVSDKYNNTLSFYIVVQVKTPGECGVTRRSLNYLSLMNISIVNLF